jgi:hypothetical protein
VIDQQTAEPTIQRAEKFIAFLFVEVNQVAGILSINPMASALQLSDDVAIREILAVKYQCDVFTFILDWHAVRERADAINPADVKTQITTAVTSVIIECLVIHRAKHSAQLSFIQSWRPIANYSDDAWHGRSLVKDCPFVNAVEECRAR